MAPASRAQVKFLWGFAAPRLRHGLQDGARFTGFRIDFHPEVSAKEAFNWDATPGLKDPWVQQEMWDMLRGREGLAGAGDLLDPEPGSRESRLSPLRG